MAFVHLYSKEGEAALQSALDAPAVKRVATGSLTLDDARGFTDPEASAAFHLIRWPDSKGAPACIGCGASNPYTISTRSQYKCRSCQKQFSLTSGTMVASRKMPLRSYLYALAAVTDKKQFRSVLHMAENMDVQYKTAHSLASRFAAVANAQGGCTVPVALLTRAAWMAHRFQIRGRIFHGYRVADSNYPYMPEAPRASDDGASLMMFVNTIVPRGLPDYVRADICQDMVLAILEGEATRESITSDTRKFITSVLSSSPWKYKWISLDAPIGEGGRSLHEVIADERSWDDAA